VLIDYAKNFAKLTTPDGKELKNQETSLP
jgi:hypothetical protein